MLRVSSLLLGLATAVVAPLTLPSAHAQEVPVSGAPRVEALPVAEVLGDGSSTATLVFVASRATAAWMQACRGGSRPRQGRWGP